MNISGREIWFWSKAVLFSGALTGWGYYESVLVELESADLKAASGVVAQLCGTMLGFVLAALAILTTVANTRLVRNMQRTGHFTVLLRRMITCIVAFGLVTVIGSAVLFIPNIPKAPVPGYYGYAVIGASIFALILLTDMCWKFWKVLRHLGP